MKYMFVVAHPDDEALGAGAFIHNRISDGDYVYVVILNADYEKTRESMFEDIRKSHDILGIANRALYSYKNMGFHNENQREMVETIEHEMRLVQPDVMFTHFEHDLHSDHRITSLLVQQAARLRQRHNDSHVLSALYFMEIPSSTNWSAAAFKPDTYAPVDDRDLQHKIDALQAYKNVVRPAPHPRGEEAIRALATIRGSIYDLLEIYNMILAAHQPNFFPYPGFFNKMYLCDIFAVSDNLQFSKNAFHNYNYIQERGRDVRITVPVHKGSGVINQVTLDRWDFFGRKIWKRLAQEYKTAPFFHELAERFEPVFMNKSLATMFDLNMELIWAVYEIIGMRCEIVRESEIGVSGDDPTNQIASMCEYLRCEKYLSGDGARSYLNEYILDRHGIQVEWLNYEPILPGPEGMLSMFHYLMYCGADAPDAWKRRKEAMHAGKR